VVVVMEALVMMEAAVMMEALVMMETLVSVLEGSLMFGRGASKD